MQDKITQAVKPQEVRLLVEPLEENGPATGILADKIMRQNILAWLMRHGRSRYVRMMEEEVARLRAENRALVNSLLGTAGFPPIALDNDLRRGPVALSPVRRRTWTQIAREREVAAGKAVTRESLGLSEAKGD